ncbi:hypothetical protein [Pseudoclavibacter sp. 13-3]|uniref:hypothetical protein n=1 Tax=Pseudoclavibacter sp. 13-3 TaxID=2901228 RepID=UPI001E5AE86D|nr:hypothetical protein [Pseudoclavibacter sp. 13-3]MCD7100439.1 hypothetical protein [Pseudoclavibacter sp. 13-3]
MTDQIRDKRTIAIPGPRGDVTPEALAAKVAAAASAAAAANSATGAATSKTAAASSATAAAQSVTSAQQVLAQMQGDTGPLLASHFYSKDETANFAFSTDGAHFAPTGIRFAPSDSTVRDPSIAQWAGGWVMVYTRPTTAGGGAWGTITTIGVATSTNGRDWTQRSAIDCSTISGVKRVWAPDVLVDGSILRVVFSASTTTSGTSDFKAYHVSTASTNLASLSWSTRTALPSFPTGIDAHIVKLATNDYRAFYSDPDFTVKQAKATSVLGTWSDMGAVDSTWARGEGPTHAPLTNGGIRLFVDCGGFLQYSDSTRAYETDGGMFYADFSADLTAHTPLKPIDLPMRHCSVVSLIGNGNAAAFNRGPQRCAGAWWVVTADVPCGLQSAWVELTNWNASKARGGMQAVTTRGTSNTATRGLRVPADGLYELSWSVGMAGMTTGWFELQPLVNGATVAGEDWIYGSSPAGDTTDVQGNTASGVLLDLKEGDVVSLQVHGSASGASPKMRFQRAWWTLRSI